MSGHDSQITDHLPQSLVGTELGSSVRRTQSDLGGEPGVLDLTEPLREVS